MLRRYCGWLAKSPSRRALNRGAHCCASLVTRTATRSSCCWTATTRARIQAPNGRMKRLVPLASAWRSSGGDRPAPHDRVAEIWVVGHNLGVTKKTDFDTLLDSIEAEAKAEGDGAVKKLHALTD